MTNKERCNLCKWFDSSDGTCDHCAFGYPYIEQNGLKPHEVNECSIYLEDESLKYEWRWLIAHPDIEDYSMSSYMSKPNKNRNSDWIRLDVTRRLKRKVKE